MSNQIWERLRQEDVKENEAFTLIIKFPRARRELKIYKGSEKGWCAAEVGDIATIENKRYEVVSSKPNEVVLRPVEDK